MKAHFFTIVLDGEPYIENHLKTFNKTDLDWHWYVIEGQSLNNYDTSWCQKMPPKLSTDGTHEYLESLKSNPRVTVVSRAQWDNKTDMCNEAVRHMRGAGFIMQIDSDEIWTPAQLDLIGTIFEKNPLVGVMKFVCRYFYGLNLCVIREDNPGEWVRAWRFKPGWTFQRHEPPIFNNNLGHFVTKEATKQLGLVFDHFSYATEQQVSYKEKFYGYWGLLGEWKKLQENREWPVQLKKFISRADDSTTVAPAGTPEDTPIKREDTPSSPVLSGGHARNDGAVSPDSRYRKMPQPPSRPSGVFPVGLPVPRSVRSCQPRPGL